MTTIKSNQQHYISQIDQIIRLLSSNKQTYIYEEKETSVKELIKCILLAKNIDVSIKEKRNPLFDDEISVYNKEFIAICLLRLWSSDNIFFENHSDLQRRTIKLIEEIISNDPQKFKEINLKNNEQTFEKVNKLKDFIKQYEDKLEFNLKFDFTDINSFDIIRNKYYRILRNNFFEQLISPFLPNAIQNKIDLLFSKVKTYLSSDALNKTIIYEDLQSDFAVFLTQSKAFNTFYCELVIVNFFSGILELVNNDFLTSPFSKPAKLTLKPVHKKYPFSQADAKFKIAFELSNIGLGQAYNVQIEIDDFTGDGEYEKSRLVGTLGQGLVIVEFNCFMKKPTPDAIITLNVTWDNFNKTQSRESFEFILPGQRGGINWEELKLKDFYSVEAVDTEDELVGRRDILNLLTARTENKRVGSSYIYGQRRVGKSSIVKTLKTELEKKYPNDIVVFYTETGDYKDPNSNRTIDQLAINICKKIRSYDSRLKNIPFPEFRGALSPITSYLGDVSEILPNVKIIIILDEFDKIPSELYRKGEIGDSFFDTIRAISNKGPYGFLLVGGERMEFIMRDQSQEVNKFKSIRVDYFDKSTNWNDFKDLIIKPIEDIFEITDDAINYLYELTSGNPFFTKVICEEVVRLMVNNRDNFITKEDVIIGSTQAVSETDEQTFAHFWKDGIRDVLVSEEEIASNRRKLLIGLITVIRKEIEPQIENVIDQLVSDGLNENIARATLNEFFDRNVLKNQNNFIVFKVQFFENWLLKGGVDKLRTTLVESDRIEQEKVLNERSKIKSQELVELIQNWNTYRGNEITTDKVRSWLEQFGDDRNQRVMFNMLGHLRFYSDFEIKIKLKEIYHIVRRNITEAGNARIVTGKESTRKDIIVSYLEDSPAKSGAEYAKLFADENKIFHKNVMPSDKLEKYILTNNSVHSIIFIDDFIGSGNSAQSNIIKLNENFPNLFINPNIKVYLGIVCGFQDAKQKLINRLKRLHIELQIHICDLLDESDKIFEDSSKIFKIPAERHLARTICYNIGSELVKNNSLGYGSCQSVVVFPKTIPNNSLPVLWASSKAWRPLFERPV